MDSSIWGDVMWLHCRIVERRVYEERSVSTWWRTFISSSACRWKKHMAVARLHCKHRCAHSICVHQTRKQHVCGSMCSLWACEGDMARPPECHVHWTASITRSTMKGGIPRPMMKMGIQREMMNGHNTRPVMNMRTTRATMNRLITRAKMNKYITCVKMDKYITHGRAKRALHAQAHTPGLEQRTALNTKFVIQMKKSGRINSSSLLFDNIGLITSLPFATKYKFFTKHNASGASYVNRAIFPPQTNNLLLKNGE